MRSPKKTPARRRVESRAKKWVTRDQVHNILSFIGLFSEFRAIHYHAAAASFAPANDFAFFLHSDRSADRASNRLTSGISGPCGFF